MAKDKGAKQEIQKTVCPVSRKEFLDHAKPIKVMLDGREFEALPKQFSHQSGAPGPSVGHFLQGKVPVTINGKTVTCTMQVMLTAVGSKEEPVQAPA